MKCKKLNTKTTRVPSNLAQIPNHTPKMQSFPHFTQPIHTRINLYDGNNQRNKKGFIFLYQRVKKCEKGANFPRFSVKEM